MTLIDRDGRVFGRFNLVDAAVAAFILLLLPIGYATYLLFRPSQPVIDSVTQVEITNEERGRFRPRTPTARRSRCGREDSNLQGLSPNGT